MQSAGPERPKARRRPAKKKSPALRRLLPNAAQAQAWPAPGRKRRYRGVPLFRACSRSSVPLAAFAAAGVGVFRGRVPVETSGPARSRSRVCGGRHSQSLRRRPRRALRRSPRRRWSRIWSFHRRPGARRQRPARGRRRAESKRSTSTACSSAAVRCGAFPSTQGRHDVMLRLDADEMVQVVDVRAGRRTRLSLAASP